MNIAILSDIHDNVWVLRELLAGLQADVLLFCGDFCAPFTLREIAERFAGPIHVIFGNNDGDQWLIGQVAAGFPQVSIHGDFAELMLDGQQVAMTHYPAIGHALARAGVYDLVCYGHDHRRTVEQEGRTVIVNPGEVMGRFGLSTYAVFDTATRQARIVEVKR